MPFEPSSPKRVQISADHAPADQEKELRTGSPPSVVVASGPAAAEEQQKGPEAPKGSKKSRLRSMSLSKIKRGRLGKGGFTRREGLIGFGFWFSVIVYTFSGSSVCKSIDGHIRDQKNAVWPCPYSDVANCIDVNGTIDGRISSSTAAENVTVDTSTSSEMNSSSTDGSIPEFGCALDQHWNETWQIWDECLFDEQQNAVPSLYVTAIPYTVTVMTTVGYGDAVGIGQASHAIVIFFSLSTIPMFFNFLAFNTALLRKEWASVYSQFVKRVRSEKKGSVGKPSEFAQFLSKYSDMIPFVIFVIITAVYLFAAAGVLFATSKNRQPEEYFSAFYQLLRSVFMLGFDHKSVQDYKRQLISCAFVIGGIILVSVVHMIMEEWMIGTLTSFIDFMSSAVKDEKPIAERTVEDIVALKPDDLPNASDEEDDLLVRHGPYGNQLSLHLQTFNASRFFPPRNYSSFMDLHDL